MATAIITIIAQKIKFYTKDFFSKCDQIRSSLRIWPHLLKKSLVENFIFYVVYKGIIGGQADNRHYHKGSNFI